MSVSPTEMKYCLKRLDCRTVSQVKKVTEYMLPGTRFAFYIQNETQTSQIVLPPALEVFRDMLVSIPGVVIKYDYYHNADMTRFPKRAHGGKKEIHYGLAFEFENCAAVEKFLTKILEIVS